MQIINSTFNIILLFMSNAGRKIATQQSSVVKWCILNADKEQPNFEHLEKQLQKTNKPTTGALHYAVCGKNTIITKYLIEKGFDVNERFEKSQSTPLHWACADGIGDTVRILLEHDADLTLRDKKHNSPLHIAASTGNVDAAKALLEHSPEIIEYKNKKGQTALKLACATHSFGIIRLLSDAGAEMGHVVRKYNRSKSIDYLTVSFLRNCTNPDANPNNLI